MTVTTSVPLRVVSVPAGHPYPRAVHQGASAGLHVLPDPDPDDPDRAATQRWWPHRDLEPRWLARRPFDLMHLHFGFDHRSPQQLAELVAWLRSSGRPLVLTVHDLRSPHQLDSTTLDHQLDVLVPSADAVVTLTRWGAEQIQRRWGVQALVNAHPPLVPHAHSAALRRGRRSLVAEKKPVVAMTCKSLRANCEPLRLLRALEDTTRRCGSRLRVLVHRQVVHEPTTSYQRDVASALGRAAERGVEVVAHEPLGDVDLWTEIAGHDVAVLPYRFGSHSGWLEMCHDVGTHVAAPSFGGYADQGADAVYLADEDAVDEGSLDSCVTGLVSQVRAGGVAGDEALEQARRGRRTVEWHERLYRSVTDG